MFDGLKDKLSNFTEDTQEDVDDEAVSEAAETPADDTEPAEDSSVETSPDRTTPEPEETPDSTGSTPDQTAPGQQAGETAVQHDDVAGGGTATVEQTPEPVSDEKADERPVSDEQVDERPVSDEQVDERPVSDETGNNGHSLTQRAKLFATGKTIIDEDDLETHLEELEFALLGSDVEYEVTQEILDGVEANLLGETRGRLESTGNIVRDALREALYDVISVGQFDFDARIAEADKPVVLVFTGVNGVGKTTTIAKLARYFERRGLSTVLANGDTYRAGANEQLGQHARNLDKKLISHEQGSDPAAVLYDAVEYAEANNVDVVLGDTAGRLHTSDGLMDQLSKIDRVIDPDMTMFVDEAVAGQDAVNRAREFDDAATIDGAVLTKADADSQGGAAISVAHVTGKPILFLGTGQEYDDLEPFDPERVVDSLLGE
ncbi:MAG: fused signal recognition particle receptor [Halovenus sp.]|jgi:fused signal recognition particle receptor